MATRHTRQSSFYFASRGHGANVTEYDAIPRGATVTEFYSRPVMEGKLPVEGYDGLYQNSSSSSKDGKTYMKQKVAPRDPGLDPPIGSLVLMRKVPLKADPKAYFAAERTFLLWLHTSLWLLSASIGIMAYAKDDPIKFMYGAFIFPVAVCFIVYSMFQFRRRMFMLKSKSPGPYVDVRGPTVLAIMLMLSIVAQFVTKFMYLV